MKYREVLPFNYVWAKQTSREQFRTGKSIFGKRGAFAPRLQERIDCMLDGKMAAHLDVEERRIGNRRNKKGQIYYRHQQVQLKWTHRCSPLSDIWWGFDVI